MSIFATIYLCFVNADLTLQNFSKLGLDTATSMKRLVRHELYSKVEQASRAAGRMAIETSRRWHALHWSTFKCVNRGHGEWTDSKRKEHKWNAEL